jgi:hypothetical protein
MAKFEIQFDLKGTIVVNAESYSKAEKLAEKRLEHYKQSMKLHFQKDVELYIDDVEEVS